MESKTQDVVLLQEIPPATLHAMRREALAYLAHAAGIEYDAENEPAPDPAAWRRVLPLRPGGVDLDSARGTETSRGWRGIPLHTKRGIAGDRGMRLSPGRQRPEDYAWTELARSHFPATVAWLRGLGVPLLLVRLMALEPGGSISPHTDSGAFSHRPFAIRTHVPLVTHPTIRMTIASVPHHLAAGGWWYTAVEKRHAVSNPTADTWRLHLVVDVVPTTPALQEAVGLRAAAAAAPL